MSALRRSTRTRRVTQTFTTTYVGASAPSRIVPRRDYEVFSKVDAIVEESSDVDGNRKRKLASSACLSERVEDATPVLKKSRKTTVAKQPGIEECPLRVENAWKIGAHVSAAGGIENAVSNAADIGANAFALFLRPQQKWSAPPLAAERVSSFKASMGSFNYDYAHVLPHGSYLVNLANPDSEKFKASHDCFIEDLQRCDTLGIKLYNFHPGSTLGLSTAREAASRIADALNQAHKATRSVVTLLENMAGAGNVLGGKFEELKWIINGVEDKTRVGVCLDTCHMFAAGYDIRTRETYDAMMSEFDSVVGLQYLRAMHLNDSKEGLGSKKDRHENLGLGKIGLRPFSYIVRDQRVQGIPMVLETNNYEDTTVWRTEVSVLNRLSAATEELDKNGDVNDAFLDALEAEIERSVNAAKAKKGSKGKGKA